MPFPILKILWFQSPLRPIQRPQLFRGALPEPEMSLAPTPGVKNTNHEPSSWASISLLCQEMSLHMQLVQVESKRNSVTQGTVLEKNVPYCVAENTIFPIKRDT
jgi:hypothetical protein